MHKNETKYVRITDEAREGGRGGGGGGVGGVQIYF